MARQLSQRYSETSALFGRLGEILSFLLAFVSLSNIAYVINAYLPEFRLWYLYITLITLSVLVFILSRKYTRLPSGSLLLMAWYLAVVLLSFAYLARSDGSGDAVDTFFRLAWPAGLAISLLFVVNSSSAVRYAGVGLIAATLFLCVFSVLEFVFVDFLLLKVGASQASFNPMEMRRAGGAFVDPNINAYAMTLGLCVAVPFLRQKYRLILTLVVGLCVLTTASRSGLIVWITAVFLMSVFKYYGSGVSGIRVLSFGLVFSIVYLFATDIGSRMAGIDAVQPLVSADMQARLSADSLVNPDHSVSSRLDMMLNGFNVFLNNPFFGSGLASSRQFGVDGIQGPHNMWITFGIEFGVIGIIVLLSLVIIFLRARSRHATLVGIVFLLVSFFSHTVLDDLYTAVVLPMGIVLMPRLAGVRRSSRHRR